jgi:putative endonuclease
MFYTYVLRSEISGRFYIGSCGDIDERLTYHNSGRAISTKAHKPWKLVYSEGFESLSEARKRELKIKSWKNPDYMRTVLKIDL